MSDHDDAERYATEAGTLLVELRDRGSGPSPTMLGRTGDLLSNEHLLGLLRAEHPDDGILSEESADDPRRLSVARVWIIDPLDGTREFTEPGRTDWAVHIALWERGLGITAAAVALPAQNVTFSTAEPPLVPPTDGSRRRVVVSRTRRPAAAVRVAAALDADLVPMGSAGAKVMAVVRGEADAYVHSGGQYEWDSAAPSGVAAVGGLHVSRLDGSPLVYNRPDPWLPDIVVCRPELAPAVLAAAAG
jgi:3'(2'), 5'-bisphosphate nucleotidase